MQEILEFIVNKVHFGIDISKIQEIVSNKNITEIPQKNKAILGCMLIRKNTYSVVDLKYILYDQNSEIGKNTFYIIYSSKENRNAFAVEEIVEIRKIDEIIEPPKLINVANSSNISGIIKTDNEIISLLNFEKIIAELEDCKNI